MNKLHTRINLAANLAIILVVVLISIVFARNYLLRPQAAAVNHDLRIPAGTLVALPGIDWAQRDKTLVLVLDTNCHFCRESAPFYQRLARELPTSSSVRAVAVLPQDVGEGKQYLNSLNVPIDEVRQAKLEALRVQGTPTLILVNSKGEVVDSWAGKLPPEQEAEVLEELTDKR